MFVEPLELEEIALRVDGDEAVMGTPLDRVVGEPHLHVLVLHVVPPLVELVGDERDGDRLGIAGAVHAHLFVDEGDEGTRPDAEDLGEPVIGGHGEAQGAGVELIRRFHVGVVQENVAGRHAVFSHRVHGCGLLFGRRGRFGLAARHGYERRAGERGGELTKHDASLPGISGRPG